MDSFCRGVHHSKWGHPLTECVQTCVYIYTYITYALCPPSKDPSGNIHPGNATLKWKVHHVSVSMYFPLEEEDSHGHLGLWKANDFFHSAQSFICTPIPETAAATRRHRTSTPRWCVQLWWWESHPLWTNSSGMLAVNSRCHWSGVVRYTVYGSKGF